MLTDQYFRLRKRVLSISTLLSFCVAAAIIYSLVKLIDVDWEGIGRTLINMNGKFYALAFVLYYSSFLFRGLRWRILAQNSIHFYNHEAEIPSVWVCIQLIICGWFINSIAWLRLGDLYRGYVFAKESGGRFSWSLGTLLAERVLDMAVVLTVIFVSVALLVVYTVSVPPLHIISVTSFAAFLTLALVSAILLVRQDEKRLSPFLPNRVKTHYVRFREGTLGSFKRIPLLLVLGLLGWIMETLRLFFVLRALSVDIRYFLIPLVALGHAILSTVPTPGGIGAVEPGMTSLLMLGAGSSEALSVTILDRTITYASVIAIGGSVFSVRQAVRRRAAPSVATQPISPERTGS